MGAATGAAGLLLVYFSTPNLLPLRIEQGRCSSLAGGHISSVHYTRLSEDFLIHPERPTTPQSLQFVALNPILSPKNQIKEQYLSAFNERE